MGGTLTIVACRSVLAVAAGAALIGGGTARAAGRPPRECTHAAYDRGRLTSCTIARATVLDGVPVAAGAYTLFHPNGRIAQTLLAKVWMVQGHDFRPGAQVKLRPDGTLEMARYVVGHDLMTDGEEWVDTATVTYDRSGLETSRTVEHCQTQAPHPPRPVAR